MAESQATTQDKPQDTAAVTSAQSRPPAEVISPDLEFIRDLRSSGGDTLKKCYQCATCSITCELSPADHPFPRKEMLWATWGLKDRLLADPDVFLCYQCNDCTTTCPRGARPGDVLAAVRAQVYRTFAVPSFMGAALSSPHALLGLFVFPILVLLIMFFVQQSAGEGMGHNVSHLFGADFVKYHHFLKHGILEGLFLAGNLLIFLLAAIGFTRYYKNLKEHSPVTSQIGFVPAAIKTVQEIILHKRFKQCGQNKPRTVFHLMVLFGFLGAAATAGLALIYMVIWLSQHSGQEFPGIAITNPIKWLGVGSGLAMVIGSVAMIVRRLQNRDDVGANGYADKLFLWMILLVAGTGLLTWLLRLAGIPAIAYPVYFVHLVLVFFILWYMPYSKFAHMIYRGLALVWANQTNRVTPRASL
jgi:quinone-modifying oxidoreductase subunit QmoC